MNRLVFTPLAEADLGEILDYIAQHRPLTAVAIFARNANCWHPSRSSGCGQSCQASIAASPWSWVIFYRVQSEIVEIHRIINGARDLDSLLG